jgi:ABC-type transport system substrate-binding protein
MMKRLAFLIALAAACLVLLPAQAQDDGNGRGVVILAFPNSVCFNGYCSISLALLMPRLFDVDPATGALRGADRSSRALARVVPPDLPSDIVTLELADRQWSDGQPVTAYDVLYNLMLNAAYPSYTSVPQMQVVVGARVVDAKTIKIRFAATPDEIAKLLPPNAPTPTGTCDALPRMNDYLAAAHQYVAGFQDFVDHHTPPSDVPSLTDWNQAADDAHLFQSTDPGDEIITSGSYREAEDGDFVPVDGTGAAIRFVYVLPPPDRLSTSANAFIAGDTNLLLYVPVNERSAVRLLADPDRGSVQIAEVPGREALVILFNFGDPRRPLPGIHPETGEVLDQGANPLFSNPAVRRALQLAIDPPALIDEVMQRSAALLAGLYPPSSWAFDPSLPLPETNIQEAQRLLDEAGWRMHGEIRTCQGCQTAEDGTPLQFALGSLSDDANLADQITRQWARIGVQAQAAGENLSSLTSQTFDAYLTRVGGKPYEDSDPDRSLMLTPAGDVVDYAKIPAGVFLNYGSYNNPEVTALLAQARTLPGCYTVARASIYHQIEHILQQDLPFIPVAAPTEFYAAAPGVLGFAPRTNDPLWNVESWIVAGADTP